MKQRCYYRFGPCFFSYFECEPLTIYKSDFAPDGTIIAWEMVQYNEPFIIPNTGEGNMNAVCLWKFKTVK